MSYVTRYDIIIMLSVAWLVGVIFTDKLRQLMYDSTDRAEKVLLTFGFVFGIALVAFCTFGIARLMNWW